MKHTVKPANPASSQATDIKGKLVGRVGIEDQLTILEL